MGYNLSRHVIRRNRPQLDQLVKHQSSMRFATDNPIRLANKLREARAACAEYEDTVEMAEVLSHYTFSVERDQVLATYDKVSDGVLVGAVVGELVDEKTLFQTERDAPQAVSLLEVLAEVIGSEKEEEVYFPEAALSLEEKIRLNEWIAQSEVQWYFIDHEDKGITLTRFEVDEELRWMPRDET